MTEPQHTPVAPAAASARAIVERKIKADGTIREYACTLLFASPGLAVVRFQMEKGGTIHGTPVEVPPGSVSDGYFWRRRPYNVYRMRRADGSLIAHRFDAVTDVRLAPAVVSYRDLVLDWWVTPAGVIIEEDREELAQLAASGVLALAGQRQATIAARQVLSRYRHIIAEVEQIERRRRFGL